MISIEELRNLESLEGFTKAFWQEYRESGDTQREVFERLNAAYKDALGRPRFPSFDAYRMQRTRALKK